ncbi:MAG: CDP-diacylglycerol---serine O-phosphatidyltransferase [Bacilli bacterium]|nr:CDP-diacylglycerol---serine O-phosphatidyltransferase [Bacilli bacterium]
MLNKSSIPNLFTFANLFCGFISLGLSADGEFKNAAILVIIGMIFDSMDGRMARILKVSSNVGLELDSLADVVTFGVAPAMLAYHIWFQQFELIGLMFTGLFPLFGAYRLARFNMTASKKSASHFIGVPIPAAGGFVLLLVLFHKSIPGFVVAIVLIGLCFLMISKIKIPSFKNVHILKSGTIITILIICSTYVVITTQHKHFPYLIFVAIPMYFIFIVYQIMRKRKLRGK